MRPAMQKNKTEYFNATKRSEVAKKMWDGATKLYFLQPNENLGCNIATSENSQIHTLFTVWLFCVSGGNQHHPVAKGENCIVVHTHLNKKWVISH